MDDNLLFPALSNAINNQRKQRCKGYYICIDCGEFIKAKALKERECPFCGKMVSRVQIMDSVMEKVTVSIWKNAGIFSAVRADVLSVQEG